jgi:phosphate transport system permease protein
VSTHDLSSPAPASEAAVRQMIQDRARATYSRRVWRSRFATGLFGLALAVACVPIIAILTSVIGKGAKYLNWNFLSTVQQQPDLLHKDAIGGVWNAIAGSLLIDGLAVVIAVPVAILMAVVFFEFNNRFVTALRTAFQIMIGLPSILYGIFIYTFIIVPLAQAAGIAWAGSIALALMMIPLIAINGEAGLRETPTTLKEAGLALGAHRSRIMLRVVMPYAFPRVLTGILLALARAVGETAPILFVIGANLQVSWSLSGPVQSLPTLVFNYLSQPFESERQACWGIALLLMGTILIINLLSRFIVSRMNRGRS